MLDRKCEYPLAATDEPPEPPMDIEFTWNREKADSNRRKHKVSFEEATTVFGDPVARIHDDPGHSEDELREIITGHTVSGQLVLVSFTERDGAVRIISARGATSQERKNHEESRRY